MDVIKLGPLMFAADRLVAVVLLMLFVLAVGKIGERTGRDTTKAATGALIAGVVAARLAYVVTHRQAYSQDWLSALAVWQGGFSVWAGIASAAAVLAVMLGFNRTTGFSVATIAGLAIAWAGVAVLLASPPRPLPQMPVLTTLDGGEVAPASFAGRPYVINIWATWCPPCRRELPMLAQVAAGSDVPILLVNQAEPVAQVAHYLSRSNIPGDAVALDREGALMRALDGGALPTTLFVNGRGEVVATHIGEISRAALLDQIARLEKNGSQGR